jgi:hypothetical protein
MTITITPTQARVTTVANPSNDHLSLFEDLSIPKLLFSRHEVLLLDKAEGTRLCGRQQQDLGFWGGLKVGAAAADGNYNYDTIG